VSEKNYAEKRLLSQDVFDRRLILDGVDTDQNISARSLTLLMFAMWLALCGRPQPEHESVMPLSPLNVLTH